MTKILLVEDDKSLREIYSVRLLAEGYTLISSGDGEEALAAAIGEKPDLIISDVMMPKISGFEMLDLLRSNENTKNIPIIMLTALSSEQQRERGTKLGADRYLIKSQVGIEDIVRTVHEVLGDGNSVKSIGQLQDSITSSLVNSATAINKPQPTETDTTKSDDGTIEGLTINNNSPVEQQAAANRVAEQSNPQTGTLPAQQTTVNQPVPASFQSAFNPEAATNPAAVAGRPQPSLPDTPMNIPTRTAPQPGMPASYAAATESAGMTVGQQPSFTPSQNPAPDEMSAQANSDAERALAQLQNLNAITPAVSTTQTSPQATPQPSLNPVQPMPQVMSARAIPPKPAQQQSAPITPPRQVAPTIQPPISATASVTPTVPTASPSPASQPIARPTSTNIPVQGQVRTVTSTQVTQTQIPSQGLFNPAPVTPGTAPSNQSTAAPANPIIAPAEQHAVEVALPTVGSNSPIPVLNTNARQTAQAPVNGEQPVNNPAQPAEPSSKPVPPHPAPQGGERVLAPPTDGAGVNPRINIDELLAGADSSTDSSIFPGAQ